VTPSSRSSRVSLAAAAVLAILLVVLASLQYRWLGQVARAEGERARARLSTAASGFAADFDREVGHVAACLGSSPASDEPVNERVARRHDCLARSGVQPLVADLYRAERQPAGEVLLSRFDPASRSLAPIPWPVPLEAIRLRLQNESETDVSGFERRRRFPDPIDGDVPALVLTERQRPLGETREEPAPGRRPVLIARLDVAYLANTLFPDLERRYFGHGSLRDYELAVVRRTDPVHALYASEQANAASFRSGDATADLLTFRVFEEARRSEMANRRPPPGKPLGDSSPSRFQGSPPRPSWRPGQGGGDRFSSGPWRLVAVHRSGSLDAAVARTRRRNLAVGFGILAVLASSVTMLAVSARRAQRLARQQIDFVAAMSHELHTPLTAIRSAGQNLADGVVSENGQVRRYGSLIESEGRRLSEMVTRVLDFAGIQSGLRAYRMRPVPVARIVDSALSNCRLAAEQKSIHVERDVPPGLPPVLADEDAIGRALQNLIDNAIKYGGDKRWMRVRASLVPNGSRPQIAISVEDRGPGVRQSERRHIFEPFYRGESSPAEGVAGSGLGLALVRPIVEAHGGTVTVESNDGGGARFTIRIPTAPDGEERARGS
jgi:signal transduction histidine kinase